MQNDDSVEPIDSNVPYKVRHHQAYSVSIAGKIANNQNLQFDQDQELYINNPENIPTEELGSCTPGSLKDRILELIKSDIKLDPNTDNVELAYSTVIQII